MCYELINHFGFDDVHAYMHARMANTLHIDLTSAVLDKLEQNKEKYPPDLYRGKAYLS